MAEETENLTFGQRLVGLKFNPSGDNNVDVVKRKFADVMDVIGDPSKDTEKRTWYYNAIRTAAINATIAAQMAVVKFLTWKD